jgi:hypothetical protein
MNIYIHIGVYITTDNITNMLVNNIDNMMSKDDLIQNKLNEFKGKWFDLDIVAMRHIRCKFRRIYMEEGDIKLIKDDDLLHFIESCNMSHSLKRFIEHVLDYSLIDTDDNNIISFKKPVIPIDICRDASHSYYTLNENIIALLYSHLGEYEPENDIYRIKGIYTSLYKLSSKYKGDMVVLDVIDRVNLFKALFFSDEFYTAWDAIYDEPTVTGISTIHEHHIHDVRLFSKPSLWAGELWLRI